MCLIHSPEANRINTCPIKSGMIYDPVTNIDRTDPESIHKLNFQYLEQFLRPIAKHRTVAVVAIPQCTIRQS